jgi:uncharacterized protein YbjT (DUF2867 family)
MRVQRSAVTGALGFTGKYITHRLLERGEQVFSLTGHAGRPDPFGGRVPTVPFDFRSPERMARVLDGVDVLYNTYWVRFPRGTVSFEAAVRNSQALFEAARRAGVRRVVHISIANPARGAGLSPPLPYYSGKVRVEELLAETGLSHAILRPTVLFGAEDILINDIAWMLRRLPLFGIPGDGSYRIQPVHVGDLADLALARASGNESVVQDAVGPETYSFRDLVSLIMERIGAERPLVHLPPAGALFLSRIVGLAMGDVVLTGNELRGLVAELLVSGEPPACPTGISRWLADNADSVGRDYHSELGRHYR